MDNFIPHANYDALRIQANALNRINDSLEAQIAFYREQDYKLREDRLNELTAALESEKAMNEKLTNEIQSLEDKMAIALDSLDRLQRLGNEPLIGNSIGNAIATAAINKIC